MGPMVLALLGALGLGAGGAEVCAPDAGWGLRPEFPAVLRGADPAGRRVTLEVEVPAAAEVLRDGRSSRLGALEDGDGVWVEYDPETGRVTTLSARGRSGARSER